MSGTRPSSERYRPGDRVGRGAWQLTTKLGAGTFAEVWEAEWASKLPRRSGVPERVAVKLVATGGRAHDLVVHEANAARDLRHPNVITVFDWFEESPTEVAFVLELADTSLWQYVDSHGPLEGAELQAFVDDVVAGLAYLHGGQPQTLHLDLRATNVLYADGRWKIADFGLARPLEGTSLPKSAVYNVDLRPPEALVAPRGTVPSIGPAWDVWALGLLIHHAGAGCEPFDASTAHGRDAKAIAGDLSIHRNLPKAVAEVVTACLRPDPLARPAVSDLLSGPPSPAPPPRASTPPPVATPELDYQRLLLDNLFNELSQARPVAEPPAAPTASVVPPVPAKRPASAPPAKRPASAPPAKRPASGAPRVFDRPPPSAVDLALLQRLPILDIPVLSDGDLKCLAPPGTTLHSISAVTAREALLFAKWERPLELLEVVGAKQRLHRPCDVRCSDPKQLPQWDKLLDRMVGPSSWLESEFGALRTMPMRWRRLHTDADHLRRIDVVRQRMRWFDPAQVTDAELKEWFQDNYDITSGFDTPERVRAAASRQFGTTTVLPVHVRRLRSMQNSVGLLGLVFAFIGAWALGITVALMTLWRFWLGEFMGHEVLTTGWWSWWLVPLAVVVAVFGVLFMVLSRPIWNLWRWLGGAVALLPLGLVALFGLK